MRHDKLGMCQPSVLHNIDLACQNYECAGRDFTGRDYTFAGRIDSSSGNRRPKEFNNFRAKVRRQGDRRSVEWLCRRDGRRLRAHPVPPRAPRLRGGTVLRLGGSRPPQKRSSSSSRHKLSANQRIRPTGAVGTTAVRLAATERSRRPAAIPRNGPPEIATAGAAAVPLPPAAAGTPKGRGISSFAKGCRSSEPRITAWT